MGVCTAFALAINLASSHVNGFYTDPETGASLSFNETNSGAGLVCALSEDQNTKLQLGFYQNSYAGLPNVNGEVFQGVETLSPYISITKVWDIASIRQGTFKAGVAAGIAYYSMGEELGLPFGNTVPLAGLALEFKHSSGATIASNVIPLGGDSFGSGNPDALVTLQVQIPLDEVDSNAELFSPRSRLSDTDRIGLVAWANQRSGQSLNGLEF